MKPGLVGLSASTDCDYRYRVFSLQLLYRRVACTESRESPNSVSYTLQYVMKYMKKFDILMYMNIMRQIVDRKSSSKICIHLRKKQLVNRSLEMQPSLRPTIFVFLFVYHPF